MVDFYHGLIGDHQHFLATQALLEREHCPTQVPDIPFLDYDYSEIVGTHAIPSSAPTVRVGNSIGCCLAVHAAGQLDQVILTAPPFDYRRGMVPLCKDRVQDWVAGLYVSHGAVLNEAGILDNASQQVRRLLASRQQIRRLRDYKAAAKAFWSIPELQVLQDRLTFVIGDQDFTTPVEPFCDFVSSRLPGAKVEVWEDCGHAVPLDAPVRLAELTLRQAHLMTH